MFLQGSDWNGWIDRQREVVPKKQNTRVKSSCTCVDLDPRDRQTNAFVWSQQWWKWCGKRGAKINRLFDMQGFVGQQTDLEQYSKSYWQPKKRTKQWNTASKWMWLCHQAGQLILNASKSGKVSVSDSMQKWIAKSKRLDTIAVTSTFVLSRSR